MTLRLATMALAFLMVGASSASALDPEVRTRHVLMHGYVTAIADLAGCSRQSVRKFNRHKRELMWDIAKQNAIGTFRDMLLAPDGDMLREARDQCRKLNRGMRYPK